MTKKTTSRAKKTNLAKRPKGGSLALPVEAYQRDLRGSRGNNVGFVFKNVKLHFPCLLEPSQHEEFGGKYQVGISFDPQVPEEKAAFEAFKVAMKSAINEMTIPKAEKEKLFKSNLSGEGMSIVRRKDDCAHFTAKNKDKPIVVSANREPITDNKFCGHGSIAIVHITISAFVSKQKHNVVSMQLGGVQIVSSRIESSAPQTTIDDFEEVDDHTDTNELNRSVGLVDVQTGEVDEESF